MTQKEKSLLLKDLSARLPYGVIFKGECDENLQEIHYIKDEEIYTRTYPHLPYWIETIKPYLRPMSSMTEEERDELELLCDGLDIDDEGNSFYYMSIIKNHKSNTINFKIIDFLISRHFDYRGLIEKGLAIEAPKDMYK